MTTYRAIGQQAWLNRQKGQLLLREQHTEGAEELFGKALCIAREQNAKLWELRAATSLARLRCDQGRRAEARDLLAPIYGWFTEGFETADLKKAKALLQQFIVSAEIANDRSRFAHCEIILAVASKVLQRLPMAAFKDASYKAIL